MIYLGIFVLVVFVVLIVMWAGFMYHLSHSKWCGFCLKQMHESCTVCPRCKQVYGSHNVR